MDEPNPYESPRHVGTPHKPTVYAGHLDALPGCLIILVMLLSPLIAVVLEPLGIFHWPATLACVSLACGAIWLLFRLVLPDQQDPGLAARQNENQPTFRRRRSGH